jgi:hypothetical protein
LQRTAAAGAKMGAGWIHFLKLSRILAAF